MPTQIAHPRQDFPLRGGAVLLTKGRYGWREAAFRGIPKVPEALRVESLKEKDLESQSRR
jgi:hypothetical protein